jgi:uncharacterized membrane protein (DUF373 family)
MAITVRRDGARPIRHVARRRAASGKHGHHVLRALAGAEDAMHYAVGILLVVVCAVVLVHAGADFVRSHDPFAERVTGLVNSVLFVVIVIEMLRTVLAHFGDAGLQLKPFLTIGVISAVRHVLTVGARVSLGVGKSHELFGSTQVELAVNAAVVIVLVIGLVLVRRSDD